MSKVIPESVIDDVVRIYRPYGAQTTILYLLWDVEPKPITTKSLAESLKTTPGAIRTMICDLRKLMARCKTVGICGRQHTGYWLEYRQ